MNGILGGREKKKKIQGGQEWKDFLQQRYNGGREKIKSINSLKDRQKEFFLWISRLLLKFL